MSTAVKDIVLMRPYVTDAMRAAVQDVLRTRWIGEGPKVAEFERQFSRFVGRSSVAVNSCTSALHLAYLLAGIKQGDTVLAPLFTCTAANEALLYCGAKIRFVDVAHDSLNMDWKAAERLMTDNVKALAVVNYGGAPARGDLFELCEQTIEDCAQSIGTNWAGQRGRFACFSFQAVKHVTTGDGGMLVLDDSLVAKAKRMRWFGIDREAKLNGTWENDIREVGFKYQMTDIGAAMGIEGLMVLEEQIQFRRELRDSYIRGLDGIDGIRVLDTDPESACWLCTVLVERREDFRRKLKAEGIESDQVHYRNDRYHIFKEFRGEFPNMDAIESKYLCVPLHMGMDIGDVERICSVIRSGW